MEIQANVFPVQTHDQVIAEQTVMPEVTVQLQTEAAMPAPAVVPAKHLNNNPATSAGLGVSEIALRVLCAVSYNFSFLSEPIIQLCQRFANFVR